MAPNPVNPDLGVRVCGVEERNVFGSGSLRLAAFTAGAVGGLSGAAYGLLQQQSRQARRVIGFPEGAPPSADGVYLPDGSGPYADHPAPALEFAVLGDSSAAGMGVDVAGELPGVLLAIGLAEETGRAVRLRTHAVVGATTRDLANQVDRAIRLAPELVLVIIGANDVTDRILVRTSAELLAASVRTLRAAGGGVVVGTCPDLGAIRPIPQPLRTIARNWSLALGRAQRIATTNAGGHPVPLADLLSPEFLTRADTMFSRDNFHPSAAGYAAAVDILLPALCQEAGVWGGPLPVPPVRSATAEARRPTTRAVDRLNQTIRRRQWFGGRIVP